MAFQETMATLGRLTAGAEALAALAAWMRVQSEDLRPDPAVAAALDAVAAELGIDVAALSREEQVMVAGYARAFLLQAAELVEAPDRAPGWGFEDPGVLLSLGRGSAAIAGVLAQVAPQLDGLEDALARDGAAVCDVGSGVAALAVALCRTWPRLRVVGLDPWAPSMRIAEGEVARAGLSDRIELREIGIEALRDTAAFDAVWLAGPFLPPAVIPVALARARAALKPGGWLLFGAYAGPPDPLSQQLMELRTIRSGGSTAAPAEAIETVRGAGFDAVREVERTWQAPVALVAGRR